MRILLSALLILIAVHFSAPKAHAVIFLPAIILLPIIKIIALIIGGFSIPTLGIGALSGKLFHTSPKKSIPIIIGVLLVLAGILAVILKLENPDRPLF